MQCALSCLVLAILPLLIVSQPPPRLNIPGAILVSQPKAFSSAQYRQPQRIQHQHGELNQPPRLRRPPPPLLNAIPVPIPAPIRPVVEDVEEQNSQGGSTSSFDDELSKLGASVLQQAARQANEEEAETNRPIQFRPERPVPVLRSDIRENPPSTARSGPLFRPEALQQKPNIRQETSNYISRPQQREELPVRHQQRPQQSTRQQVIQPTPQPFRQPPRAQQPIRQPSQQLLDDEDRRRKKPQVQILRKYRTDNEDGSITWGFENDDGTFKEETLGADCMVRGKYGYIDPDGVRREYSYETGNKCDQTEEPEEEQLLVQGKQPQGNQGQYRKPQLRPLPVQY